MESMESAKAALERIERENQRSLWLGLGLQWDETPGIYREWIITNLTNEVRYINVSYDVDQDVNIQPGRNLLCLCNTVLRAELCSRNGYYTLGPYVSVSKPVWEKDPEISYVYKPQRDTEHIIIKYKNNVTSLQDSIVAMYSEEKLDYLKNNGYKSFFTKYQTHRLNFSFDLYEDPEWSTEETWPWTACSCVYKRKMKKLN